MRHRLHAGLGLLVAGITACGDDAADDATDSAAKRPAATATAVDTATTVRTGNAITVTLNPLDNSGVSGEATLQRRARNKVDVAVRLDEPEPGRLPAHLHIGTCAVQPNLDVLNSLENVVRGRSDTVLQYTTWPDIETGTFSIHVHAPGFETIACGDLSNSG